MISKDLLDFFHKKLEAKKSDGSYKQERVLVSPQDPEILVRETDVPVLNFCANNYLGLSNHPAVRAAARTALDAFGFGMSSVRFICGTHRVHKDLEAGLSRFLGTEDSIVFTSCFDANGGLFENFLGPDDLILSASLNHASIIDGARLSKARRRVFPADDMRELGAALEDSEERGIRVVVTDGVFSMEGDLAPLREITALCERHGALLVVDDSHATGILGPGGRGTGEHFGVHEKIDLFTGTLGKALGGASGGFISGKRECIEWFRNASRPYLFSNALPPSLAAGALKALEIASGPEGDRLREKSRENTRYFREAMQRRGFKIKEGVHPIIPIMLGEAGVATAMADALLKEGIYVIGFSYPVVPRGAARIRVQISAAHTRDQLDRAIAAFEKMGRKIGVI